MTSRVDQKALFQKAIEHVQQKDLTSAELVMTEMLSEDSEEPNALRMMGSLQLAKKEFGLAVDYLEKAVEAAPGFASAVIELSSAHHQMGNLMMAASGLRFFLDANPRNAQVWQALANLLFEMGELEEGQNAAQKSVEFDPFYDDTRLAINSLNAGTYFQRMIFPHQSTAL